MCGKAEVTPIADVARLCHRLSQGGKTLACGVADVASAFSTVSLSVLMSLLTVSSLQPSATGAPALLVPLSMGFGHTASPAAFHVPSRAIQWIVDTQPTDWWHGGFADWVAAPPSPRSSADLRPVDEIMQSLLAAMVFVLSPRDPERKVLQLKKIIGPGAARCYTGWIVDCARRSVRLSRRGVLKLAIVLWADMPPGRKTVAYDRLRSAVYVLQHYTSLNPEARAFTCEAWALLLASGGRTVHISAALAADLRWWRALLRSVWNGGTTLESSWASVADVGAATAAAAIDASQWGGGIFIDRSNDRPSVAWRVIWLPDEIAAVTAAKTDTNVLEFAVHVLLRLVSASEEPAMRLESDSTSALSWAAKGRPKTASAFGLAQLAAVAAFAFKTRFRSSHLAGVLNVAADALSRWNEPDKPVTYHSHRKGRMPEPTLITCTSPGRLGKARRLLRSAITGRLQADGAINRATGLLMDARW